MARQRRLLVRSIANRLSNCLGQLARMQDWSLPRRMSPELTHLGPMRRRISHRIITEPSPIGLRLSASDRDEVSCVMIGSECGSNTTRCQNCRRNASIHRITPFCLDSDCVAKPARWGVGNEKDFARQHGRCCRTYGHCARQCCRSGSLRGAARTSTSFHVDWVLHRRQHRLGLGTRDCFYSQSR